MYQALYRKWRPKTFDDVVGQSHITRTLKRQIITGRLSHAYLFTGTRGTGKTTCAKLLAKAVNCENPVEGNPCGKCPACLGIDSGSILDVVELDAASNNGVDQVRALRDEAIYSPAAVRRRVYIVDEVHMLSVAAFNALLKILEEPPEHLMFILATTELHKVPATILSRCQRFSFKRIQPADIQNRMLYIAQAEGIDLSEDGAALLARLADGALRDALSLLDQCAVSGRRVDKEAVLDALGLAGNTRTAHIMNHIRKGNTGKALTELSDLYAAGKDVSAVLSELSGLTRDLLLRQTTGGGTAGLMTGGYDEATMQALSKGMSPQRLLHMLTLLQDAQAKLKTSADRRTDAELCLIRLCDRRLDGSVLSLSERLTRLEAALANGTLPASGQGEAISPQMEEAVHPFVVEAPEEGPKGEQNPTPEEVIVLPMETDKSLLLEQPMPEPEAVPKAIPTRVQEPEQRPVPQRKPALPAPLPKETGPRRRQNLSAAGDPQFWQELAPTLQPVVGPIAFGFISKQMVSGMYADGVLTLYVLQDAIKKWLSTEEKREKLEEAASAKAGQPVHVKVEVGKPQAPVKAAVQPPVSKLIPSQNQAEAVSQQEEPVARNADPLQELLSFAAGAGKGIVIID